MSRNGPHYVDVVVYQGEEETRLPDTYRFADNIIDALVEKYGAGNIKTNRTLTDNERMMRCMEKLFYSAEESTQKNLELISDVERDLKELRSMFAEFIEERNCPLSERER